MKYHFVSWNKSWAICNDRIVGGVASPIRPTATSKLQLAIFSAVRPPAWLSLSLFLSLSLSLEIRFAYFVDFYTPRMTAALYTKINIDEQCFCPRNFFGAFSGAVTVPSCRFSASTKNASSPPPSPVPPPPSFGSINTQVSGRKCLPGTLPYRSASSRTFTTVYPASILHPVAPSSATVQANRLLQAEPPDLVKYGLIPELVGRFPLVVSTQGLDLEQMVEVSRTTTPHNPFFCFARLGIVRWVRSWKCVHFYFNRLSNAREKTKKPPLFWL